MTEKKFDGQKKSAGSFGAADSGSDYGITANAMENTPIRTYKDRVFRMIFKEKEEFLELYNALNGTHYTDTENMVVTTLDNAIYFGMKNDVSYLLRDELALYEHQSSKNPNMPLRNLFYVSNIYSDLTKDENLHGTAQIKIPEPIFLVFYNGTASMPEHSVSRLSDAYIQKSKNPALELETVILNINPGYNEELMNKCKTLREYMIFVSRIREYQQSMEFDQAVNQAVDECIEKDILREFLRKNKAEVLTVSIFEYDAEKHMKQVEDAARRDGLRQGMQEGIQQGEDYTLLKLIQKKQEKGMTPEIIAEFLELDIEKVRHLCAFLRKQPDADVEVLHKLWRKENDI